MIITIGREFGSYGHVIGKKLAEKLGIKYYDKESMAIEAKKSSQYEELKAFYEEEPVSSLLYVIALDSGSGRHGEVPFQFIRQLAAQAYLFMHQRNIVFKKLLRVESLAWKKQRS